MQCDILDWNLEQQQQKDIDGKTGNLKKVWILVNLHKCWYWDRLGAEYMGTLYCIYSFSVNQKSLPNKSLFNKKRGVITLNQWFWFTK